MATAVLVVAVRDSGLRLLMRHSLEEAGYLVAEAADAAGAIRAVREYRPCVLVLDGWLGGLDRADLIGRLRADTAACRTRVLMLGASQPGGGSGGAAADRIVDRGSSFNAVREAVESLRAAPDGWPS